MRCFAVLGIVLGLIVSDARAEQPARAGVIVYGATPAGIAAALAAADDGETVLLVEPTARIGGLVTNGLSHTDFRTFEGLSGTFLDFAERVEAHYVKTYGKDSQQVRDSFRGTFGEPGVNLAIFQQMLEERKSIVVSTQARLDGLALEKNGKTARIVSATFVGPDGTKWTARADVFIDGSYEGDLMAKAGVPWRVGRESRDEYGESLAPERADGQLQAYNFRFVMTKVADNRVAPTAPPGYRREDFLPVVKLLEDGKFKSVFGYPSNCIFKAHLPVLPNGKYDINDVSRGLIRLSLAGRNGDWPDGDAETRRRIFAEHLRDQGGLLYFLQNDDAVPKKFRDEAREWGWCKDEFADSGHLPAQLYVREARRMVGVRVYTQADSDFADNDARARLHTDAIAIGDYGNNCHGTSHEGPRFGGKHTGEFYRSVPPYQIPYGVLVPRSVENLLVPGAVSSSHVGFCALRLEPIWTSLGQAAGHAAHLARAEKLPVQKINVPRLQARLHAAGSATVYVSDVPPGHADFALVQWWGTAGGFHGLAPTPKGNPRGKNITGQYYETFPNHAAELDKVLDADLADRWQTLARSLDLLEDRLPKADGTITRGNWLRAAGKLRRDCASK